MRRSLFVGVDRLPVNFDMEQPAGFRDELGADLFQNIYEQLTSPTSAINDNGVRGIDWHHLRADLAEQWTWSDDRRTWTFRIRHGVYSASGKELTADDVKWGWDRAFALRDVGKWVARISSVRDESSVKVVDPYTIAFHLDARNPALPRMMTQCTPSVYDTDVAHPWCTAEDPWAKSFLSQRPAGFGPYWLASLNDEAMTLRSSPRYWRGPAAIEEARFQRFGSRAEAIQALQAGHVHVVLGLTVEEAAALRGDRSLRVVAADTPPGTALHIDVTQPPFDNVLVRRAVAHAIPYQEVIGTAFLGTVQRWRSWLQPESPGYAPEEWKYEEDLEQAKRLMEQAGVTPFRTSLLTHAADGARAAAGVIADGLARIGIDVTLEDPLQTRRSVFAGDKANLAPLVLRAGSGRGHRVYDPLYVIVHDFGPGRMRLVRYAYDNPGLTAALDAVMDAGDGWDQEVRRAQAILNADAAVVPICWSRFYVAHHRDLEGYRWYPDNRIRVYDLKWR